MSCADHSSYRSRSDRKISFVDDAGDTVTNSGGGLTNDPETNVAWLTVTEIRQVLQAGDAAGLHPILCRLTSWKKDGTDKECVHNYWRVAQFLGETELNNIHVLMTLAVNQLDEDATRWRSLEHLCHLLSICLCNREIVYQMINFFPRISSILVLALNQGGNGKCGDVACYATRVMEIVVTVCRSRFARYLVEVKFLDQLLQRREHSGHQQILSKRLFKQILLVLMSLLTCKQASILEYANACIDDLSQTQQLLFSDNEVNGDAEEVKSLLYDLQKGTQNINQKSTEQDENQFRNIDTTRTDSLSTCLGQPFLLVYCSWPACGKPNSDPTAFLRKCGACRMVRYCSRQCQEKHWQMGHKEMCNSGIKKQR